MIRRCTLSYGPPELLSLVRLLGGDLVELLRSPASLLFGYWVAMGAWRRTSWGRPASDAEIIGPPVLTASRARQMIVVAGGCVTAVTVALALQLIAARS